MKIDPAKIHDVTMAVIMCQMGVEASKILEKTGSLGSKVITGDAVMDFYKSPFCVYLSKDMFVLLFKNVELLAKELAAGSVETYTLYAFLNSVRVLEAHLAAIKVVRIKLTEIVSREQFNSFCAIQKQYLENLKPIAGSEKKLEKNLTVEEILQFHILDASTTICKELDFI